MKKSIQHIRLFCGITPEIKEIRLSNCSFREAEDSPPCEYALYKVVSTLDRLIQARQYRAEISMANVDTKLRLIQANYQASEFDLIHTRVST